MPRCLHMNESGLQCLDETLESSDFCEYHQKDIAFPPLQDSPWRKAVLRFVALVLLLLFLIPFVSSLRKLYSSGPARAQEVW